MDQNAKTTYAPGADMRAISRSRGDTGGATRDEMMDAFADRIAAVVDARLEEVRAEQRVDEQDARDRNQIRIITALASLIVTVPTTAVLWHTDGPTAAGAIWLAVLLLNIVAMMKGRAS